MIIFRPIRVTLEESLVCAEEFENEDKLKEYLCIKFDNAFTKEDIVIKEELIQDNRTSCVNTYHVCINRCGNDNYIEIYGCPQCIGYCQCISDHVTEYIKNACGEDHSSLVPKEIGNFRWKL